MKLKRVIVLLLIFIITLSALAGCAVQSNQVPAAKEAGAAADNFNPGNFLQQFKLDVTGDAERFDVTIPKDWSIKPGAFPEGLYWALANEYSKDAGLDLTALKGKTVKVWRYSLADGLPGRGEQSSFKYPSKVILLVDRNQVVGAWLAFNVLSIGPSLNQKYLEDITGLFFDKWLYEQKLLVGAEEYEDLAAMDPVQVLNAFCRAIEAGDKARANACMSPDFMLSALTMNLQGNALYNKEYSSNNSFSENLLRARLISYKLMDPGSMKVIYSIGDRDKIEIEAQMQMQWKDDAFNTPDGVQPRFAILKKYETGWKLESLGTGP